LGSRSNHQSKSIAQSSSWSSVSSQNLEGLVELLDVFEEDEGSESEWLNIRVEVSNISQNIDGISKISESSVVESLSFTGNNVGSVCSSSNISGEIQGLSD